MKKWQISGLLAMVFAVALLFGCATQTAQIPYTPFSPANNFSGNDWEPKVDNFFVVLDNSYSMTEVYKELYKFNISKSVVERMAQTMPAMDIMGALREFGEKNTLVFGSAAYKRDAFLAGLAKVGGAAGNTPLNKALESTIEDLAGAKGKSAVIIVSDGLSTDNYPVATAKAMKEKYGDRVCIYTILVGDSAKGKKEMDAIADAGGCGFASSADDLLSAAAMADFVEKVFIWRYKDSDGDGVWDHLDKCPGTPKGVKVDKVGCPLPVDKDSDGDGVMDKDDKCPGTPKGAKVNADGCWVLNNVLFDFDKAVIKTDAYGILDEVAMVLKNNPGVNVRLDGHTDSVGAEAYNMGLSERRVKAVKKYLVDKGVNAGSLSTKGYGESRPVTTNKTKEGRALNRRVELTTVM